MQTGNCSYRRSEILLQNAFKFTHPLSEVPLKVYALGDRILIEVEDKCGGLPPGDAEGMFLPFARGGTDKTGRGLGLSISRRSVEANGGTLNVRDLAASGMRFHHQPAAPQHGICFLI